jgi:glycerol-3-phosphate dehydrogenase (NAD(P)+)
MSREAIAVLGAGAWGVALANVASQGRKRVPLWAHDPAHAAALARDRENRRHLPGLPLAAAVEPTSDLSCVRGARIVLAVVPAQALRAVARAASAYLRDGASFVMCAKAIERA